MDTLINIALLVVTAAVASIGIACIGYLVDFIKRKRMEKVLEVLRTKRDQDGI